MATSDIQDLAIALNMFKESTNSFSFDQSVRQAKQEASQKRAGQEDELDKRKKLQQVANNLSMQAALTEKPASTIDALNKAIGPEQFATTQQAALAGALQNKPELTKAAMDTEKALKADEMALRKQSEEFQLKRDEAHANLQRELAGLKGGKLHALPTAEVTKLTDQQSKIGVWTGLIQELETNPSYSSLAYSIPVAGKAKELFDTQTDPAWAAWKSGMMNQYFAMRKEITGVAGSLREYSEIQKNQPSFGDTTATTLAKMNAVKHNYEIALARKMHGLAKAKYDVTNFDLPPDPDAKGTANAAAPKADMQAAAHQDALSHLPPDSSFAGKAKDPRDGKIKSWYKLPNGSLIGR